ncbi:hypothetical protein AcV5_001942 [Taiwanofungus camphoratus]|nr:hypothetical protein AcV5_001942 [Antrodia cinnamomea]KAI0960697.1 hypothetical protein AcV7_000004 [Antrodia cinnamomea]
MPEQVSRCRYPYWKRRMSASKRTFDSGDPIQHLCKEFVSVIKHAKDHVRSQAQTRGITKTCEMMKQRNAASGPVDFRAASHDTLLMEVDFHTIFTLTEDGTLPCLSRFLPQS